MCGIIGFNWKDGTQVAEGVKIIKHRGPDDSGIIVDNSGVSLGNVRLSILDLSSKGHMPMTRKDKTITYNGEIYNFKEIKEDLKEKNRSNFKFTSNTDTEVILSAYGNLGEAFLEKLNGMFAFCIHDKKRNILFLARDRFGIKPLYYYMRGDRFAFCSEIKGILDIVGKKEVDTEGLEQFFTFRFTLGETTLVKGIKKFLPGHYMIYDLKKNKIKEYKQYYSLKSSRQEQKNREAKIQNKPLSHYKDKVRELMEKSVERRMVSDVPVATLLSGGIDSSIITALAKKHNPKLNTFSIAFDTTDELSYARLVAKKFRTNHREFKVTKDNLLKHLDKMIYHMDEPIGDPAFLPILALSKEVKKHNKVVLSGDGADEIFCGYDRYKMYKYGMLLRNFVFFDSGNDIIRRLGKMKGKNEYNAFFEIIRLFDDNELKKLGIKKFNGEKFWNYCRQNSGNRRKNLVACAQEFDIKTLLPNDFFMKADKMSSAYGLEQRVPFMDHELVEFAFSIPMKYKIKRWNEKYILKEAFRDILPEEIVKRRKFAFHVPIDYWFRNVLGEKLRALLKKSSHNLYNKEYVYQLLEQMQKKGSNYKQNFFLAQKLWSILVFEMWHEKFIGTG